MLAALVSTPLFDRQGEDRPFAGAVHHDEPEWVQPFAHEERADVSVELSVSQAPAIHARVWRAADGRCREHEPAAILPETEGVEADRGRVRTVFEWHRPK